MKTLAKTFVAAAALSLVAGAAFAQEAATNQVTSTGEARIIQPVTVEQVGTLNFGTVVRGAAGTVAIDAATGARTVGGGAVGLASTTSRIVYTVKGEGGQTFGATVPTSFNLTGPSTIPVTLVKTTVPTAMGGTAGAEGSATFGLGGNFAVAADTPIGAYTGTFEVSVVYN